MKTVEELAKEIVDTFPALKDKPLLVEKFARMGALLEDKKLVLKQLCRLEAEVSLEYQMILYNRELEFKHNKPGKYYHALRKVLERQESKYGFNASENLFKTKPAPLTLTGFVPPDVFSNVLLKLGYHWKDPGAGAAHGEYTHRIQWYIFTTSGASNGTHALEMFKAMGDPECCTRMKDKEGKEKAITMWDYIVDCFETNAESVPTSDSARAPNYLMTFMLDNRDKLKTLCAYLQKRTEKRSEEITESSFKRIDELVGKAKEAGIDVNGNELQVFMAQYLYTEKYAKKYGMEMDGFRKLVGEANIYPPLKTK